MKNIKYVIHQEGDCYVAQCLNVDVSSFGISIADAIDNIVEAVELYFEGNAEGGYIPIDFAVIGDKSIHI